MAMTPSRLYVGQITSATQTLVSALANKYIVKNIVLTNTGTVDGVVNIHIVPSGGTAGNANKVIEAYSVKLTDAMTDISTNLVLETGDTIQVTGATINAITVYISGVAVA